MTTIKATCPLCGDVELTPSQVRLMVCARAELSYYAFTCTSCAEEIRKPADKNVVALLVSGGVAVHRWSLPAEAMEEHHGPAIGYDDVLDFVLNLDRITDLAGAALESGVART